MKILMVSRAFYPQNNPRSIRTTELIREFCRLGHEVTLLTTKKEEEHKAFEQQWPVTIQYLGSEKWPVIDVHSPGPLHWPKRIIQRVLLYFFHYPDIEMYYKLKRVKPLNETFDLLISIAAPHSVHWGTEYLVRKGVIKANTWIADCGDPFMRLKNDPYGKAPYFSVCEKKWCRKADCIALPIEDAKDSYYPEFLDKMEVIPQGVSVPEIPEKKTYSGSTPVFAYAGNIRSYWHYATPFFEQLNQLNREFKFIIYTIDAVRIRSLCSESLLQKIEFRDYVPREELIVALSQVDFLLHFPYQNDGQRSLKLIDYGFTKTPVLSLTDSQESYQAFERFLGGNYEGQLDFSDNDQFRVDHVAQQFLNICKS